MRGTRPGSLSSHRCAVLLSLQDEFDLNLDSTQQPLAAQYLVWDGRSKSGLPATVETGFRNLG